MSGDTVILLLILWAICGFAASVIAGDRGRSRLGFFFVTFLFLGPLGPGFALVARHGEIEEAELRTAREENREARENAAANGY